MLKPIKNLIFAANLISANIAAFAKPDLPGSQQTQRSALKPHVFFNLGQIFSQKLSFAHRFR
jgi:hypothetical protein